MLNNFVSLRFILFIKHLDLVPFDLFYEFFQISGCYTNAD